MNPLISVVVPIYNVQQYLEKCIDSIIAQTYTNIEIILVDDGSKDGCPAICDEYAKKDDRIRVIHKPNGGLSSARNAGIEIATGEYISFVDSDDYISEDMIEQLYDTLQNEQNAISVCLFTSDEEGLSVGINKDKEYFTSAEAIREILLERKFHTSAVAKLYPTRIFDEIRFPVGLYYEDFATMYKLFAECEKIVFVKTYKYFYVFNPDSITKATFSDKQMDYFTVSDQVHEYLKSEYPNLVKALKNRECSMAISFYIRASLADYHNQDVFRELVRRVRANAFGFLGSNYAMAKRLFGVLIAVFPAIARVIVRKRGKIK